VKFLVPNPKGPALPEQGITLSSRQLKRAEAEGKFPRRVALYPGANVKGWPSSVIENYLAELARQCEVRTP
jgi:hypothetical protein